VVGQHTYNVMTSKYYIHPYIPRQEVSDYSSTSMVVHYIDAFNDSSTFRMDYLQVWSMAAQIVDRT